MGTATHDSASFDRLQALYDTVSVPIKTLEEEIDHAIAEQSNSIAVDLLTGIIVLAKGPAETLFGYKAGTLKGKSIHELIPHRFREAHEKWLERYRQDPTPRTMGSRDMKLFGLHHDGYEFPVEISLSDVKVDGLHLGIATIIKMLSRT